jgi:hypothetical protein
MFNFTYPVKCSWALPKMSSRTHCVTRTPGWIPLVYRTKHTIQTERQLVLTRQAYITWLPTDSEPFLRNELQRCSSQGAVCDTEPLPRQSSAIRSWFLIALIEDVSTECKTEHCVWLQLSVHAERGDLKFFLFGTFSESKNPLAVLDSPSGLYRAQLAKD